NGCARGKLLPVSGWKRAAELPEQFVAASLAEGLDQRILQIVLPPARGGGKTRFQFADIELRNVARRRPHGDHDARQPRLGLVRVAAWSQLGSRDDIRSLAPKQWYVARVRAVGGRCEQAEKAVLADDLTAGVEALDRYVIEIAGPVDCRA